MNKNPAMASGITIGLIVLVLVLMVMYLRSGGALPPRGMQVYFTVDDGKTYFSADRTNIAPWTSDGKEAVRCHVFKCNDQLFVGYLTKNIPKGKSFVEQQMNSVTDKVAQTGVPEDGPGALVKLPGASNKWISQKAKAAVVLMSVKCPDGTVEDLVEAYP
jgi:hypothetical protein